MTRPERVRCRIDTAAVRKAIEAGEPIPPGAVVPVEDLRPRAPLFGRWGRVIRSEWETVEVEES